MDIFLTIDYVEAVPSPSNHPQKNSLPYKIMSKNCTTCSFVNKMVPAGVI